MHRNYRLISMLVIVFVWLSTTQTEAVSISVNNASFEDPALGDGGFTQFVGIPGWNAPGGQGVFNPTVAQLAIVPDGSQVGFSNGGTIAQVLGAILTANTSYILDVDVARRGDGCCGNPTATIQLLAGSTVLNQTTIDYATLVLNEIRTGTVTYFATAADPHLGEALQIALVTSGPQADYDHVRLDALSRTAVIPEPSTFFLFSTGVAGLLGYAWRWRKLAA